MRAFASAAALGVLALVAGGCGGGAHVSSQAGAPAADYLAAVSKAADVTQQVSGYRFAMTSTTSVGSHSLALHGSGSIDDRGSQGSLSVEVQGKQLQELIDRPFVYIQVPQAAASGSDGKQWLRANINVFSQAFGNGSSPLESSSDDPTQTLSFLRGAGAVSRVGTESVRGVPTTHYHATIELDRYAANVAAGQRAGAKRYAATLKRVTGSDKLPLDVWIDGQSRVRRISLALHLCSAQGNIGESISMDLYDYGHQPVISIPPASQVKDISGQLKGTVQQGLQQLHC